MPMRSHRSFTAFLFLTPLLAAVACGQADDPSAELSSTLSAATTTKIQIDCGGKAAAPYVADVDFAGGSTIDHANAST
jgi:hypothetical protein